MSFANHGGQGQTTAKKSYSNIIMTYINIMNWWLTFTEWVGLIIKNELSVVTHGIDCVFESAVEGVAIWALKFDKVQLKTIIKELGLMIQMSVQFD